MKLRVMLHTVTSECTKILDEYFKYRERLGEVLKPSSPVFRQEFDSVDASRPKQLSVASLNWLMFNLSTKSGIRERSRDKKQRDSIMQCHGFRKYFMTTATNAGINPVYCEYLMGHKTGLTKSYFKPTDSELLEGNDKAVGYVGIINDLTINEEFRLMTKVEDLSKKKNDIELMESKHNEEIKAMREDMNQIMTMIQQNPKLAKVKPEALVKKKL